MDQETKVKIMALYYGQNVLRRQPKTDLLYMIDGQDLDLNQKGQGFNHLIEVKPLSSIIDEDAIEVAKIMYPDYEFNGQTDMIAQAKDILLLITKAFNGQRVYDLKEPMHLVDYLRSKGYALPAYGFSVEQLVESGIFKLTE
jgi:hypothetical protein